MSDPGHDEGNRDSRQVQGLDPGGRLFPRTHEWGHPNERLRQLLRVFELLPTVNISVCRSDLFLLLKFASFHQGLNRRLCTRSVVWSGKEDFRRLG